MTVTPDLTNLETIMDKLVLADPFFSTNIILNQGSYLNSIQIIQKISSLLNVQSYSDKLGLLMNKSSFPFPQTYGPMANYSGVNAVIEFKSKFFLNLKKLKTNLIKIKTQNIDENLYNVNRNRRSRAREALSLFLNGLSISDMDSVRTQLGMLSIISIQTDELSRASEVNIKTILDFQHSLG